MKEITVSRDELIKILEANREKHIAIFNEAMEGYQKRCEEELVSHLERVRAGKIELISVHLPMPYEHTRDYDRVLKMVQMSTTSDITLSEEDVAQYVMDDWAWKRQWVTSSAFYSETAKAESGK